MSWVGARANSVQTVGVSITHPADLANVDLGALGRRIRDLRAERGLTQADVAGSDISAAYISRIEGGQRRPEMKTLMTIADRLATTVDHLLTGVRPEQTREDALAVRYAELALNAGDPADALHHAAALLCDERAVTPIIREQAAWVVALASESLGDYAEAIRLLESFDRTSTVTRSPAEVGIALSRCYRETGALSRAIEVAAVAVEACEHAGLHDTDEAVQLLVTMAAAYHERGDVIVAANLCRDAIERADRIGSPVARASAYWNASRVAAERGQDGALALADRALAILGEADDRQRLARLRLHVGLLLLDDPEAAAGRAEAELTRARCDLLACSAGMASLARCDAGLAAARLSVGDDLGAEEHAQRALEEAQGVALATAYAHAMLGRVAIARGDRSHAWRCFSNAAVALTAAQADREAAQLWFQLGAALDEAGDAEAARDAYRSAAASTGLRLPVSMELA
jgi:transcriptional regulator with XRE-family HTH domain